ncbi:MAG: pyruvate kinase [Ruminococcus sp.]|jgi:pyruvate kinase|nr:pyruvate kinase [Ruminococcus sp.]
MRKTKIICTIGPATDDDNVMREMMLAGMNVARFNFSHGDYDTHRARFNQVEKIRHELGLPIATLLDTKGPEIRLGSFVDGKPVILKAGDLFTLTSEDVPGTAERASITYKGLVNDLAVGRDVLIDDGAIEMKVEKLTNTDIICKVVNGGKVSDHKGINVPGTDLSLPYVSEKDMADLKFGASMGYDFVAASFCRSSADVNYLRMCMKSLGWSNPKIIAKIENSDGVKNIDEIIAAADGIMVARGDMGVEIAFELIPSIQKQIINKVYTAGKYVITATQMLESMIGNPRPTRAEITDVANAIYDGTSAIMLSGETAAGAYPVEAVRTMAKIAETTEDDIDYKKRLKTRSAVVGNNSTDAISHAAVSIAHDLDMKAIVTVTKSGNTARNLSKFRPSCIILGCTPSETALRQLSISWGVIPVLIDEKESTDDLLFAAVKAAKDSGILDTGDTTVVTAGLPLGIAGNTNMLKITTVE